MTSALLIFLIYQLLCNFQQKYLYLGLTAMNPQNWDGKVWPREMKESRGIATGYGNRWVNGKKIGVCKQWTEKFGDRLWLNGGDRVTLTLCGDRSVSISHNHTEVTQVFTDLPHTPLWVVLLMAVKKMAIIPG